MIRHGVAAKRLAALAMAGTLGACGVSSEPVGTAASCPVPGTPLISAHRGGAAYAPANTMTAFANAARLGLDELEMDTQLTASSQLVVHHHDTPARYTHRTPPARKLRTGNHAARDQ